MIYYIFLIISFLFILAGIIGLIFPFLPSVPMVFVGILIFAIATKFAIISIWIIFLMLFFTIISQLINYAMSIYGAKYFGATKYGIWGGIIGIFVGIILAPFGLISIFICPPLGTLLGEIIGVKKFLQSSKSSLGSLLGIFVGTMANIFIIAWMISIFIKTVL